MPTDMENYLFDLRGYLILKNALTADEVAALNAGIDEILPLEHGEWYGHVHGHTYGDNEGTNLQQIYEGGAPFEALIDHPSWFEKVKHFVGGEGTFDYKHRPTVYRRKFRQYPRPRPGNWSCIPAGTRARNVISFAFTTGAFIVGRSISCWR